MCVCVYVCVCVCFQVCLPLYSLVTVAQDMASNPLLARKRVNKVRLLL
jgi:hypothetical protein